MLTLRWAVRKKGKPGAGKVEKVVLEIIGKGYAKHP